MKSMFISGGSLRVLVGEDGHIFVAKDVPGDDGVNHPAHLAVVDGELKWVEHKEGGVMEFLGRVEG